jgi:hypothetical protein
MSDNKEKKSGGGKERVPRQTVDSNSHKISEQIDHRGIFKRALPITNTSAKMPKVKPPKESSTRDSKGSKHKD